MGFVQHLSKDQFVKLSSSINHMFMFDGEPRLSMRKYTYIQFTYIYIYISQQQQQQPQPQPQPWLLVRNPMLVGKSGPVAISTAVRASDSRGSNVLADRSRQVTPGGSISGKSLRLYKASIGTYHRKTIGKCWFNGI